MQQSNQNLNQNGIPSNIRDEYLLRLEKVNRGVHNTNELLNDSRYENMLYYRKTMILQWIFSMLIIISIATLIVVSFNYMNTVTNTLNQVAEYINITNQNMSAIEDQINDLSERVSDLEFDITYENNTFITEQESKNNPIDDATDIDDESYAGGLIEDSDKPNDSIYNNSIFSSKSGYNATQLNAIIDQAFLNLGKTHSSLHNIGDGLYQAEQEYNVNALYLLGIASLESGWGTSILATQHNNVFGLIGLSFDSYYEGSVKMGEIIRFNYINEGLDSLSKIQSKYCPNGGEDWINNVQWCTDQYVTAATELYSQL